MAKLILGTLSGGVLAFLWGLISWTLLPWHMQSFESFINEKKVQEVLFSEAPRPGVYLLPNPARPDGRLDRRENEVRRRSAEKQVRSGPFALVVASPGGVGPLPALIFRSLLIQLAGALFVTWFMLKARIPNYFDRISFILLFAVAAGIICYLPDWNWWGFPAEFSLMAIADVVIGWFLAGLLIAKITAD